MPLPSRILIVDSERFLGKRVKDALRGDGRICYWCQAEDEALLAARFFEPEAILLHVVAAESMPWPRFVGALRDVVLRELPVIAYGIAESTQGQALALEGRDRPDEMFGPTFEVAAVVECLARIATLPLVVESEQEPPLDLRVPRENEAEETRWEAMDATLTLSTHEVQSDERPQLDPTELGDPFVDDAERSSPSFRGDLRETSFDVLLWRLTEEPAEGELRVLLPEGAMSVYFSGGRPVAAVGGGPTNALGPVLVRAGLLSQEAFRGALAELAAPETESGRLGEILLREGAISESELKRGLAMQAEQKIVQLFEVSRAPFAFYPGRPVRGQTHEIAAVPELLLQGLERLSPSVLASRLGDHKSHCPVLDRHELPELATTDAKLHAFLDVLDGTAPLDEILARHASRRVLAAAVALGTMGLVHYRATPSVAASPTAEPEPAAKVAPAPALTAAEEIDALYDRARGHDHYAALGISAAASVEEVARACEAARASVAPDRVKGLPPGSVELVRAIELRKQFRAATKTLTDASARRAYDEELGLRPDSADRLDAARVQEVVHRAAEAMEAKHYGPARELYEEARSMAGAENAEARAGLGYCLYMSADDARREAVASEALAHVRRALEIRPRFGAAAYYAAEILRDRGRLDEAVEFYRLAAELDPKNARIARALKRAQDAVPEPRGAEYVLLVSDLAVEEAGDLEEKLRNYHRRAFVQAAQKHFMDAHGEHPLVSDQVLFFELKGRVHMAVETDPGSLPETVRRRLLSFPGAFRKALLPHMERAVRESDLATAPTVRVRFALSAGAGRLAGQAPERSVAGPVVAIVKVALARDAGGFVTDEATLARLLPSHAAETLRSSLGYDLSFADEPTRAGKMRLALAHPSGTATPVAPASAPPVAPLGSLARLASADDLEALEQLDARLRPGVSDQLEAIFSDLAVIQAEPESGGLWDRVMGRRREAPDVTRVRLRTRLFEPVLQGSRIFLGLGDLKEWLRLLEEIGSAYCEALWLEGRKVAETANDGVAGDLASLAPNALFAVVQSCRFLGAAFVPEESYDDTTFAELTRRAARRVKEAMEETSLVGKSHVADDLVRIYEGAIDTPDDTIEPVNIFEYLAVLALMGVTDGIRAYEVEQLSRTHKKGSTRYDRTLAAVHDNFDRYIDILRGGLRRYQRIDAIFTLSSDAGGRAFADYDLPLYYHIAERRAAAGGGA